MRTFEEIRYVTADGSVLAGSIYRRPVSCTAILMHGGGQTRHSWLTAMRRLADEGYQVVSYDARGHGESSWADDGAYSIPLLSADLQAVRATIPGAVAIVGASLGGMTAFYTIGSNKPDFAEALILVDIVPRSSISGIQNVRDFMTRESDGFATIDEAITAVQSYNPRRRKPTNEANLYCNLRLKPDGRLHWHWDPKVLTMSQHSDDDLTEELIAVSGGISIPVLPLKGGRSDVVDEVGMSELQTLVPQTEICEIADSGHMIAGDDNDAFNNVIVEFLRRHVPPLYSRTA